MGCVGRLSIGSLGLSTLGILAVGLGPAELRADSGELLDPSQVGGVPIVGGEPTDSDEFVHVVAVVAGKGLCTGTLVAPNLVITAGHCLAELPDSAQVAVFYGDQLVQDQAVAAASWGAHPKFDPCNACEDIYDYGYVVTESAFNPPFAELITTQEEWDQTMTLGAEVTLVGFGDDPDIDGMDSIGIKRKVTTTITRFSEEGLEFFAGGNDRDSCQGDSGGPAFVTLPDGTTLLAGITSRGSDPCGSGGFYGAPYPALCWIQEQTGVDLLNGDCSACDCVDTTPPPMEDDGCQVAQDRSRRSHAGELWALGLVLITIAARPRR